MTARQVGAERNFKGAEIEDEFLDAPLLVSEVNEILRLEAIRKRMAFGAQDDKL